MSDEHKVGYGCPPRHSRFPKGVSGNPKGRPRRLPPDETDAIIDFFNAPIEYRESGKSKRASSLDVHTTMVVARAKNGDVDAAQTVLKMWMRAGQIGTGNQETLIEVTDWLPSEDGEFAKETPVVLKPNTEPA